MCLHVSHGFHKPIVAKPLATHKLLWGIAQLSDAGRGA